jgi:hypothetical protein
LWLDFLQKKRMRVVERQKRSGYGMCGVKDPAMDPMDPPTHLHLNVFNEQIRLYKPPAGAAKPGALAKPFVNHGMS